MTAEASLRCDMCQSIAERMKQNISHDSIVYGQRIMLKLCDKLPTADSIEICKQKVNDYVIMVEELYNHSSKELCQSIGLCPPDVAYLRQLMGNRKDVSEIEKMRDNMLASYQQEIKSLFATRTTSIVGCETCMMVLQQIQELIKMPQVQNTIDKAVEMTCQKLAGSNVNDCIEQSKAYVHEAIKFIQEQDPRSICAIIGECQSIKSKLFTRITESFICDECKKVFDTIKAKLADKDVRDQLEQLVVQVCDQFPEVSIRQQCHRYTNQIIDNAIEQLESSSGAEICQALHVC